MIVPLRISFILAPNSTLTGSVQIQEGTLLGAGTTVKPYTMIGKWSVIGAGAVVTSNIPDGVTAVGVPAKVVRKNNRVDYHYVGSKSHLACRVSFSNGLCTSVDPT